MSANVLNGKYFVGEDQSGENVTGYVVGDVAPGVFLVKMFEGEHQGLRNPSPLSEVSELYGINDMSAWAFFDSLDSLIEHVK